MSTRGSSSRQLLSRRWRCHLHQAPTQCITQHIQCSAQHRRQHRSHVPGSRRARAPTGPRRIAIHGGRIFCMWVSLLSCSLKRLSLHHLVLQSSRTGSIVLAGRHQFQPCPKAPNAGLTRLMTRTPGTRSLGRPRLCINQTAKSFQHLEGHAAGANLCRRNQSLKRQHRAALALAVMQ